jgi:hypothetical protein
MKKEDLVGTWRFVGFEALSPERKDPGPTDGRLIYTADGHMSAGVLRGGAFWGYCARYEIDGDTLVHHMILGNENTGEGSVRRRRAKLDGKRLTLSVIQDGKPIAALTWERVV